MSKLSPEEELEKQYRDYKAQFEQWKEKNKNSVGTEAYIAYVEQFEAWERDVDKRREMIRAKAETEAQEVQAAAHAKAQATAEAKRKKAEEIEEEQRKKQMEEANAYAQHQQSYLAHHQAALQKEQQLRQVNSQHDLAAMHGAEPKPHDESLDSGHMAEMMEQMAQMAQMMIGTQQQEISHVEVLYQQPVSQPAQQQVGPPPQLWGSERPPFDSTDPMFKKWGLRAAPPYYKPAYRPPPPEYQPPPCWMFIEQMNLEKLMLAPQATAPAPAVSTAPATATTQ